MGKYHVAPENVFPYEHPIEADVLNPVEMAHKANAWIEKHAADGPFFLYYATIHPHRSGTYMEDAPHRPNDFHNRHHNREGIDPVTFSPDEVVVPPYLPDTPAVRAELAQYYQAVATMDQGIGIVLDRLQELGLWDNTLILYLPDNGIAFPGAKTNLYQAALRLPLLIKTPKGDNPGQASDGFVSWVDIAPTILDYAGILEASRALLREDYEDNNDRWDNVFVPDFHGRSIRPLLEDPDAAGRDEVYASHTAHEVTMYYPMRAVITRDYKLIWNIAHALPFPHAMDLWHSATWQYALAHPEEGFAGRSLDSFTNRPAFELYDMRADPFETTNLADDPAHAATLEKLKQKIRDFQKRTSDPWLLKWDRE